MDERSIGVILRVRPLTETSLIVHWLTPDLGRVATVARMPYAWVVRGEIAFGEEWNPAFFDHGPLVPKHEPYT